LQFASKSLHYIYVDIATGLVIY